MDPCSSSSFRNHNEPHLVFSRGMRRHLCYVSMILIVLRLPLEMGELTEFCLVVGMSSAVSRRHLCDY
jgi:hypothetical protein